MNLEPITNRLQTQGVGTPGVDVFINFIPASVSQGVMVRDYFGGTPTTPELPGFYKTSFMLIVRSPNLAAGRGLLTTAMTALTVSSDTMLGGYLFKYIRARNLPFPYAPSPGQLIEIAINMDCCFIDAGT